MEITEVRLKLNNDDSSILAFVDIIIDQAICIHDIALMNGPSGRYASFPAKRDNKGVWHDVVHTVNATARNEIEKVLFDRYDAVIARQHE